ncbi:hypothetical protein GCM10010207_65570 [Streptomyces atratus]|nr:hypothetical protein GCM10010207_65570 [Streptomyces atratus]
MSRGSYVPAGSADPATAEGAQPPVVRTVAGAVAGGRELPVGHRTFPLAGWSVAHGYLLRGGRLGCGGGQRVRAAPLDGDEDGQQYGDSEERQQRAAETQSASGPERP